MVTPLIAIMKDQVEHLNKIRVAAAMMGEDVDVHTLLTLEHLFLCNLKLLMEIKRNFGKPERTKPRVDV